MGINLNKNENKNTDMTFSVENKRLNKLLKKASKNNEKIKSCEKCKKGMIEGMREVRRGVNEEFKDTLYNAYTKNNLLREINKSERFQYRQVMMGVGISTKCKKRKHLKIIRWAGLLFSEINRIEKHIDKK